MRRIFTILFLTVAVSAFCTNVTFKVDMNGSGMTYDSVFIVGTLTDWNFVAMNPEGDEIHSVTLDLNAGDTSVYYFITQNSWDNYEEFREPPIPNECGDSLIAGWAGDRLLLVPEEDAEETYIWGTCNHIVGVEDHMVVDLVNVFPNPTNGVLNLDLSTLYGVIEVVVFDISGKSRQTFNHLKNQKETVFLDLNKGIYFIKVNDEANNFFYQKIIIE